MECKRVELAGMDDDDAPAAGTLGTVLRVGALGDLEVEWDDGSRPRLIPGVDEWKEKLRVVVAEPGRPALEEHVDNTLSACQRLVGGSIDVACPFDGPVLLVANDNAIAEGHGPNRTINGRMIPGPFFLCGEDDEGGFCPLARGLTRKYVALFRSPESFPTRRLQVRTRMACPLCGRDLTERPATSRADDRTPICPRCGTREAPEATGLPATVVREILPGACGEQASLDCGDCAL